MTGRYNPSHYSGMTSYLTSELTRLLHNVLAFGTIADVDHATVQVRLDINGRLSAWLPAPAVITQNYRGSFHLRIGTQVLVACPSGDPGNAVIVAVLYSDSLPTPSTDGGIDVVQWNDGTRVDYDAKHHRMSLSTVGDLAIKAAGSIHLQSNGDLWIDAPKVHFCEASPLQGNVTNLLNRTLVMGISSHRIVRPGEPLTDKGFVQTLNTALVFGRKMAIRFIKLAKKNLVVLVMTFPSRL